MLTDTNIERRCRYKLQKHGMRMHKETNEQGRAVYCLYDIGGNDTRLDDLEHGRWFFIEELLAYCEELEEKEKD